MVTHYRFNSTMVRLKDDCHIVPIRAVVRFNSTMVRLKAVQGARLFYLL